MIKIIVSCILLLGLSKGYSQQTKLAIADKKYERFAYIDAIATYEKVAEKGYKDEKMFQRLGNAYYFTAELIKAEKWYTALFDMNPDQEAEYCYRYALSLKSIENYKKADEILELFYKKSGNDQRAKLFSSEKNYLEDIKENSNRFTVEDAGINSAYSDYGSSFWNNKLVFASARDTTGTFRKISKWTNQSFTNLYSSELDENFNEKIKSRFRDDFSYASFSGGEKMRIDLALLFTWRAVAKLRNSATTNLLIMDEVFHSSLDSNGTDEFLKILNDLTSDTNVFIISHKGDTLYDKFHSVVKFEKHKNFSRIAQ